MRSQSREGDLAMGRRKKSGGGAAWSLYRLLVNITLTAQFLNTKPIRHSLKWPLVLFIFGLVRETGGSSYAALSSVKLDCKSHSTRTVTRLEGRVDDN